MKIIKKTYFLVGILIVAAGVNLLLLYQAQQESTDESFTIIRAGDLKVKVETIASLASSIAAGNEVDRNILQREIVEFDLFLRNLRIGGAIQGQPVAALPDSIIPNYDQALESWHIYKNSAEQIKSTSVFNEDAVNSVNYVLEKNGEMAITTDSVVKELEDLGRDYNRHKEISVELHELSKGIGQNALLLSIGEEEGVRDVLHNKRISFEAGLRKLLQISTDDLDLASVGEKHENLEAIPRENSNAIRQLDPLWEAVQLRIVILETESLLSEEFGSAMKKLNDQRIVVITSLDNLLNSWNQLIQESSSQRGTIVQTLLVVDIALFFLVILVIRQSLNPLATITTSLSRVKEGIYGEKIEYHSKDEIGELVDSFNIMSDTIKQKVEEAKKTDIAKDEFLSMITHELKTPLVPIQGYVDILLGEHLGKLTAKQRERLEIIKSSSESLLRIISDLLDAQKLELGKLIIKKENINIKNTFEKALETLKPDFNEKQIKITKHIEKDIIVPHDSERIIQVITNLLRNSINAVQPKTGVIEIFVEDAGNEVKIKVKDNGFGIPVEKQKDLFKKFYQVDTSLTREVGGSGLGLAICKGIVEEHGGSILAESSPNVGSTFSFTLPKRP
jgi:signal transduction histidine kinase